jgi:hypothetical protein
MVDVGRATDVEVVDGAAVVEGELDGLDEQAAASTATAPMLAATVTFRNPGFRVSTFQPPLSTK